MTNALKALYALFCLLLPVWVVLSIIAGHVLAAVMVGK